MGRSHDQQPVSAQCAHVEASFLATMNLTHPVLALAATFPRNAGAALGFVACGMGVLRLVYTRWWHALDHLLYRDYYELGPTIQRFSQELGALREQDDVVNLLLDGLVETLNLSGVAFVGLPEGLDPGMLRLIEPEDLRPRRDFATPGGSVAVLRGLISVDLAASRLSWAMPLLLDPWPGCAALVLIGPARSGLGLGLLVVGPKRAGGALRRDDRMLLVTLAHQAGTALENAALVAGLRTSLAQVEVSTMQLVAARAEQQLLLRELVNADERQRAALARELHDDALQEALYLIRHSRLGVELLAAFEHQPGPMDTAADQLPSAGGAPMSTTLARLHAELSQLAERSVVVEQRLRALCMGLYPALLHSLGLPAALDDLANEHALATGMRVTVECPDDTLDAAGLLDSESALHMYRIAQEGLRNASKHAGASSAHVELALVWAPAAAAMGPMGPAGPAGRVGSTGHHTAPHPLLQLDIEDDGSGMPLPIDYAALLRTGHLGLAGMRERAQRIGATLTVTRAPGGGAHIRLCVPIDQTSSSPAIAQTHGAQRARGGDDR